MPKKLSTLILFSTLFSIFFIYALTKPVLAGVVLTEGEFIVLGTDPSPEDYVNEMLFQDMTLEIDDLGKVKGSANVNFSDLNWKGSLFSGNATLNLEGNYDTKENSLSGRFTVRHTTSMINESAPPKVSFYNNDVMTFEGAVSGGWSSENGSFELLFNGTKRSIGKTKNSNGSDDDYDRSTKWNNKAVFKEDLCASLVTKAENENKWKFIQIAQAKDSGARFTAFSGEVLISPKGNVNDERPAEDDMVLEEGDVIQTGGASCAIISYADMSTFIMKARTQVILGAAPEKQSKLKLVAGNIWVNLKHIYETGHLDVTMNQAVAGTKGTTFIASEDGTNSTIKVIEGLMGFQALATGQQTDVGPGEMVSADANGITEKTTFDIETEFRSWKKIRDNLSIIGLRPTDTAPITEPSSEIETNKSKEIFFVLILSFVVIGLIGLVFARKRKK
ncbi:MAG: FecR family protein [Patescibacteria group bacterium]